MSQNESKLKKLLGRKILMGVTVAAGLTFFTAGIVFWGGFNTAMEATNTMEFCIGCHEMENNVYKEYKPTIHYANRTGVRAGCPDCHVPDPWVHKMVRKIQASNELLHKALGTIDTPEKFEKHRLAMAKRVWNTMKETDSRECRNCHNLESMAPQFQKPRARNQHLNAMKTGQTCIDCHKGIAHHDVRDQLTDEELEELEAPNEDYIREIPEVYISGMKLVAEREAEAKQKSLADSKAQEDAEAMRVTAAVEEAIDAYKAAHKTDDSVEDDSAATQSINVNWAKADAHKITIFYPGETSLEWVLNGRDHGGSRPFTKGGERCVTCHEAETAEMGEKMVTGEKAESSPIPGKRGSIPVTVNTTYDDEYLYMRFTWADVKHNAVPFVDGGKMDPENPIKLAVMFATDDVEYADRAGCWATCHHDANSMPDTPDGTTLGDSEFKERLDLSGGVTKYLKESRSKLEIKGRRGKKRGGWDKLKSKADIDSTYDDGKFMDIVRYKSGSNIVEDGYVLEQRQMLPDSSSEFSASLKGGKWVVMMKRKLVSNNKGDINLSIDKIYNFGFAIHDDYSNSRFHHVSLGYKLGFNNEDVELNAKKQ